MQLCSLAVPDHDKFSKPDALNISLCALGVALLTQVATSESDDQTLISSYQNLYALLKHKFIRCFNVCTHTVCLPAFGRMCATRPRVACCCSDHKRCVQLVFSAAQPTVIMPTLQGSVQIAMEAHALAGLLARCPQLLARTPLLPHTAKAGGVISKLCMQATRKHHDMVTSPTL